MSSTSQVGVEAERHLREGGAAEALALLDGVPLRERSPEILNLRGRALVALGRRDEAALAFREAAELDPSFERAWANLAKLAADAQDLVGASSWIKAGLAHAPRSVRLLRAAANAELRLGRPHRALPHLEALVELEPSADLWRQIGDLRLASGLPGPALDAFIEAFESTPLDPRLLGSLVTAARTSARAADAHPRLGSAIGLTRDSKLLLGLAQAAWELGAWDLVERATRAALEAEPSSATAALALVRALDANARSAEAEGVLATAVETCQDAAVWLELARRRRLANDAAAAGSILQRALARFPDDPRVHVAYAEDVRKRDLFAESLRSLERAVELAPLSADARSELGHQLVTFRRADDALVHATMAMRLRPCEIVYNATVLFDSHYVERPPRALAEEHVRFGAKFGYARPVKRVERSLDPERPLRIGYLSGDFREHSVAYFLRPILERQSQGRDELVCYASQSQFDHVTESFRRLPLEFRDVQSASNTALAEMIVNDGIDVLIDLGGMTRNERFGVFARRAAPVQVTYLGYPDTTGFDCFDYRITDSIADPPGESDALHVERLLRMPVTAWCFHAGHEPVVLPLPERPPTFCCFNFLPKITDRILRCWARILEAVPGSKLILKSRLLADPEAKRQVLGGFSACGVDISRVEFLGWVPTREAHLRFHHEVDVALDPMPYGGTTTTCDALWMGVPVVSLRGEVHSARVGESLLRAVGLDDLVAHDDDEYVNIAVSLAANVARRRTLRTELRERLRSSPLGDPAQFVPAFDELLRGAWRTHVEGRRSGRVPPPDQRLVELGGGLRAVVPADPATHETFPVLEQGRHALPELAVLELLRPLGGLLIDAAGDAALPAISESVNGVEVRIVRSDARMVERVTTELAANGLDVASLQIATAGELPPDMLAATTTVRLDHAPEASLLASLEAHAPQELRLVCTLSEGEGAPTVEALGARGYGAWVSRPGLGVLSPWTAADVDEIRQVVVFAREVGASRLHSSGVATQASGEATLAGASPRSTHALRERSPESSPKPLGEDLRLGEDRQNPIALRLASLESAASEPSSDEVEALFAAARAHVLLGRRSRAAALVQRVLSRLDALDPEVPAGIRPLPSQDAQVLEGSGLDCVEQLAIEAYVKLTALSSISHGPDVRHLLVRYQTLGGPDLEMARRLGLLLARDGLAD